jgi:hypothetical protein
MIGATETQECERCGARDIRHYRTEDCTTGQVSVFTFCDPCAARGNNFKIPKSTISRQHELPF